MAGKPTAQTQIARDAVRRFGHLGNRTIARHLIENYGELWDNDLEKARRTKDNA